MGSAFWISSVVGGHHNLMLRREQPGNPLYQLLAADHGALLGKWRQCYRNRLSPQKHTSFFRQQSFKGMAQ